MIMVSIHLGTMIETVVDEAGDELTWEYEAGPVIFQRYSLKNALLRVDLPTDLQPGQSITLSMTFETKFPESLSSDESVHRNFYTWRFDWNPIAIPTADLIDGTYFSDQRPYYERIFPASLYSLTLTVPSNFTVVTGA